MTQSTEQTSRPADQQTSRPADQLTDSSGIKPEKLKPQEQIFVIDALSGTDAEFTAGIKKLFPDGISEKDGALIVVDSIRKLEYHRVVGKNFSLDWNVYDVSKGRPTFENVVRSFSFHSGGGLSQFVARGTDETELRSYHQVIDIRDGLFANSDDSAYAALSISEKGDIDFEQQPATNVNSSVRRRWNERVWRDGNTNQELPFLNNRLRIDMASATIIDLPTSDVAENASSIFRSQFEDNAGNAEVTPPTICSK